MKIQSCSIDVPPQVKGGRCVNHCAFCVAQMTEENYKNQMDVNLPFFDLYLKDYLKRLEFVRDNGCNTLMLTGNIEPQQNRVFLTYFGMFMLMMDRPFRCIEMQTTGVGIDREYLRFLRNHVGVNTISLSMSNMFDAAQNGAINGTPKERQVDIAGLCQNIKEYDFNLRLSLNLNSSYNERRYEEIFAYASQTLGADQITFRVMYDSGRQTPQDEWIEAHRIDDDWLSGLYGYIREAGKPLSVLEYGQVQYDIWGMSTIIDDDCMNKELTADYKYLILRPNCKLYSQWDSPASLIF